MLLFVHLFESGWETAVEGQEQCLIVVHLNVLVIVGQCSELKAMIGGQ